MGLLWLGAGSALRTGATRSDSVADPRAGDRSRTIGDSITVTRRTAASAGACTGTVAGAGTLRSPRTRTIAGAGAFRRGLADGQPILLEPIMNLKVTVPGDLTGDIISDLNTKRARVLGMTPHGDVNNIEALAPLAEIQHYAIDLKSMTQGRASYIMEFDHYEEVPAQITQKIVAQRQAEKTEKS